MEKQPHSLLGCEYGLTRSITLLFLQEASTILHFHGFQCSEYSAHHQLAKQHAYMFIKYIHISLLNILGT